MSLYPVLVFATATISVSLQLNCGTNYTYKDEWQRNWCVVPNCFFDEKTKTCRECSACNQVFKLDSDGPMLQCQVEGSDHNLCAPSEITVFSFVEEKIGKAVLFIGSALSSFGICLLLNMLYNLIYKPECRYWFKRVGNTSRYQDDENLRDNEIQKLYRDVDGRKIAKSLAPTTMQGIESEGHGLYSNEELTFRFFERLREIETKATIVKKLCRFGYGELVYRIFTCNLDEPQVPDTRHEEMQSEVILNLCRELYNINYARNQFVIAIELGLSTTDIDICRQKAGGSFNEEAMYQIFAKWKLNCPCTNYTFQYIRKVLQRAEISESLIDSAVNCSDSTGITV